MPDPIIEALWAVFVGFEDKSYFMDPMVSLSQHNLEHEPMIISYTF